MGLFSNLNDKVIKLSSDFASGAKCPAFSEENFQHLESFIKKNASKSDKCRMLWEVYLMCAICYDVGVATKEDKQKALEYYEKVRELTKYHKTPDDRKYGLAFVEAMLETNFDCVIDEKHLSQRALTLRRLGYASLVTYKKDSFSFFNSAAYKWVNFWTRVKEKSVGDRDCENVCGVMCEVFEIYNTTGQIQLLHKFENFVDSIDSNDDYSCFIMFVCFDKGADSFIPRKMLNEMNPSLHAMRYLFKSAVKGNVQAAFLFYKEATKAKDNRSIVMEWMQAEDNEAFLVNMMYISTVLTKHASEKIDGFLNDKTNDSVKD